MIKEKDEIVELWILQMLKFVCSLNIDEYLKREVATALNNQKDLIKNGTVTDGIYGIHMFTRDKIKECNSFFEYLNTLQEGKEKEYFETGINYALTSDSDIGFLDNFLRFIVITNYGDINIVDDLDKNYLLKNMNDFGADRGSYRAYLGGFLLCDLSQFTTHQQEDGEKYLDFYNFHSRKNMTRTKVGTLLIKGFLNKMISDEILNEFSLGSVWVMKNNSQGKKFYEKLGFKFLGPDGEIVDYHYYDDCIEVKREDYPELSDIEFYELSQEMGSNFCVVIPSNEKPKIVNKEFEYPFIEYDGERIDCKTDFSKHKNI